MQMVKRGKPKKYKPSEKSRVDEMIDKCLIGKTVPECTHCRFGLYIDIEDVWSCNELGLLCGHEACYFKGYKERICECVFKSDRKNIFWGHLWEVHKDSPDLVKIADTEYRSNKAKALLSYIEMCPCGSGYGRYRKHDVVKHRWYTKDEIESIKKDVLP